MMKLNKRSVAKGLFVLLFTLGFSPANACQCFTVNYIHHLFFLDKSTRCFAHKVNDVYISATIVSSENAASSNKYGCELNLGNRYYRKDFVINSNDNMRCIAKILASCRTVQGDDYRKE